MTPQVHTPPPPPKLGQQHAAFPLPEGSVSLSFPAEMSVASAQMMASFVKLLLDQAQQQAKLRAQRQRSHDPHQQPLHIGGGAGGYGGSGSTDDSLERG